MMLAGFNPNQIEDVEGDREAILRLLNLLETLKAEKRPSKKYYSPSEGKAYMAKLPPGYEGQFGPGIKAWAYVLYFAMNITEAKSISFFETVGISISSGKVSEILLKDSQSLHAEKTEIVEAGLGSTPWQQIR